MDPIDKILKQWAAARPDLDVSAMAPVGRLRRASRLFESKMSQTFEKFGLNSAGFDVLATLRRSGAPYALSAGRLMSSMMIASGTMTNRIDKLEKAGLVTRTPDPQDARIAIIQLTDKGFTLIDEAVVAHTKTMNALLAGLSEAEIATLNALLKKLSQSDA